MPVALQKNSIFWFALNDLSSLLKFTHKLRDHKSQSSFFFQFTIHIVNKLKYITPKQTEKVLKSEIKLGLTFMVSELVCKFQKGT
jgi:hypothetical protein